MATVTFILGLCGAGKTWLADRIVAAVKFDENFLNDAAQHKALVAALRAGKDAVVVEIAYCHEATRNEIMKELVESVPSLQVRWLCIENDVYRANKNCRERTNKAGSAEAHVEINGRVSPGYSYPSGSVILRMWTRE